MRGVAYLDQSVAERGLQVVEEPTEVIHLTGRQAGRQLGREAGAM